MAANSAVASSIFLVMFSAILNYTDNKGLVTSERDEFFTGHTGPNLGGWGGINRYPMGLLSDDVLPGPNEQRNQKQLLKWEDLFIFTLKSDDLDENNY